MSEHGELVKLSLIRRPAITRRHSLHCDPRTLNIWNVMKCTILEIMRYESSKEVITDTVYNAVRLPLMKNSDFIYADLYGHLESIVDCIAESLIVNVDNEMLRHLLDAWNKFRYSVTLITHVFPIVDGVVSRETDCSFVNVGRTIFETGVFQHDVIREYVTKSLLGMADAERRGLPTDRTLFRHACSTLKLMSVYDSKRYATFERKFLEESKLYYRRKCQELLATDDTLQYLSQAERALDIEDRRLSFCLPETTARANVVLAEKELVQKRLDDLIALESNGITQMLEESRTSDLALLYRVLRRAPLGRAAISDHVTLYLERRTHQLTRDMDILPAEAVVDAVFAVSDLVDALLESSFKGDGFLKNALCGAFKRYVTCDERLSVFLAQYTDSVLRRQFSPEVDARLGRLVRASSLLPCKDAVRRLHKAHVSARLLAQGASFHEELLGRSLGDVRAMLLDLKRSDILTDIFQKHPKVVRPVSRGPPCEFSMRLLSSQHWPLAPPSSAATLVLPARPRCHFINFTNFYRSIAPSRRLVLLPEYGTAELLVFESEYRRRPTSRVSFVSFPSIMSDASSAAAGPVAALVKTILCRLDVSTVQMCVLCLFNDADKLTARDMRRLTNVDPVLLYSALRPLCARKLLLSDDDPSHLDASSVFSVNPDAFPGGGGAKTNHLRLYDEGRSYKASAATVLHDDATSVARRAYTDVVILRVIKVRGALSHDLLVSQTVNILKNSVFTPTSLYVTRRINALLHRNMIERKPDHSDMYCYTSQVQN